MWNVAVEQCFKMGSGVHPIDRDDAGSALPSLSRADGGAPRRRARPARRR
eukprot:gene12388-21594_t